MLNYHQTDVCTWSNWTSCEWFCGEKDPGNKTRHLKQRENVSLEDLSRLCEDTQTLGCNDNCTGFQYSDLILICD